MNIKWKDKETRVRIKDIQRASWTNHKAKIILPIKTSKAWIKSEAARRLTINQSGRIKENQQTNRRNRKTKRRFTREKWSIAQLQHAAQSKSWYATISWSNRWDENIKGKSEDEGTWAVRVTVRIKIGLGWLFKVEIGVLEIRDET